MKYIEINLSQNATKQVTLKHTKSQNVNLTLENRKRNYMKKRTKFIYNYIYCLQILF